MSRKSPKVSAMTHGQLKLHYAALCQYHGCNGVAALGYVHRLSEGELRTFLMAYEIAAADKEWDRAQDALLGIATKAINASDPGRPVPKHGSGP